MCELIVIGLIIMFIIRVIVIAFDKEDKDGNIWKPILI